MAQRLIAAIMYGAVAVGTVLQANGIPQTAEGWIGLAVTFIVAFWGKFSSEQTFLAANRIVWSAEQRKVEGGK